ncbi:hydantoinase/oxoprolinase family protein [Methanopyrus kandleri]
MKALGLDVGGAHTDAALVRYDEKGGKVMVLGTDRVYLPMWKKKKRLKKTIKRIVHKFKPDVVGLTMTGELADAFNTRREGVEYIVRTVTSACHAPVYVVTSDGSTVPPEEALRRWREVASANWRATAEVLAHVRPGSYLLVDLGSTTLDLIPIIRGEVAAEGRTDLERMKNGELAYLGALRTPIPFLLREVEIDGEPVPISYEYFSIVADALLLLGEIDPEDYTPETPDGRGKSPEECARRLARTVCSDPEELGWESVMDLAKAAVRALLGQLLKHIELKLQEHGLDTVVAAGAGDFLVEMACKRIGVEVELFDEIFGKGSEVAPAVGAAFLAARS